MHRLGSLVIKFRKKAPVVSVPGKGHGDYHTRRGFGRLNLKGVASLTKKRGPRRD